MSEQFRLEDRYVVLKIKDIEKYLHDRDLKELNLILTLISAGREADGRQVLEAIVVEKDWPEYGIVYSMLERRSYEELLSEGSEFKFRSKYSNDLTQVYHALVGPEWVDVTWTTACGSQYSSKYRVSYISRGLVKGDFYLVSKS